LQSRFPELAKQWHRTLNDSLLPSQVTAGSMNRVWWQCPEMEEHFWQAKVTSVRASYLRGTSGCPYCAKAVKAQQLQKLHSQRKSDI
jgi:hypothetical protein